MLLLLLDLLTEALLLLLLLVLAAGGLSPAGAAVVLIVNLDRPRAAEPPRGPAADAVPLPLLGMLTPPTLAG
jgi:hypothetical protein